MKFVNDEKEYGFVFETLEDFWMFLQNYKTETIPYYATLTFEFLDPKVKIDFNNLKLFKYK